MTDLKADILTDIIYDIRSSVPEEIVLSQEPRSSYTYGPSTNASPTIHIDGFLYDDDAVNELLIPQTHLPSHYCVDCGSRNVKPITRISHSMSVTQLKYIFRYLLPDLSHRTLVDVGSRLGAVLYGAYLFSEAERIIGVEIDSTLCDLQNRVIEKYKLSQRIQVVCDDVCNQMDILKSADVVVLNNVFEFFCPIDVQKKIWTCLRASLIRAGTVLVMSPCLEDTLKPLETDIVPEDWLVQIDTSDELCAASLHLFDTADADETDLTSLFCYRVL